jgi:hypothetical protein
MIVPSFEYSPHVELSAAVDVFLAGQIGQLSGPVDDAPASRRIGFRIEAVETTAPIAGCIDFVEQS